MQILNKSIKRLALLSTAAILPMLAITSCGDSGKSSAGTGLTQEYIRSHFEYVLQRYNNVSINTRDQVRVGNLFLSPNTEIIRTMEFNGQEIQLKSISISSTDINYTTLYTVTPQITFPTDNSGIILRMVLDDISTVTDGAHAVVKIEYLLHYNIESSGLAYGEFDLDLDKSSFRIDDGAENSFGSASPLNSLLIPPLED